MGLLRAYCDSSRSGREGRQLSSPAAEMAAVSLQHLTRLRVLNLGLASAPMVDFATLPSSLQCLHLNLASGFSVGQLATSCATLAAAGPRMPQLRHISLGMELDALLRNSQGAVLAPLSGLTQITSLALTEYQYLPPDAPTHEGYAIVPPLLQQLPGLRQVDLRLCSGQHAQLGPAARVADVRLVLTLARHEQVQFNRLPRSVVQLTGLTSLTILMAEFVYEQDSDLYVFDASPLALCPRLASLLLELHGAKCCQHDLRGLAQLRGLQDLVVLFKCPDVHDARPELEVEVIDSAAGAAGVGNGAAAAAAPGSAGSTDSSTSSGLSGWLSRTTSALRRPGSRGIASMLCKALSGSSSPQALQQQQQQQQAEQEVAAAAAAAEDEDSRPISVLCEEWLLQLLDTALDQLRPEFALTVPPVSGRLLLATTSRLLLRAPHMVTAAAQPMLVASHLQLDCESVGDMWGGECFLTRRSPPALQAWVNRNWQPHGVELLAPARYPKLSAYPGCRQRINDRLLVAARKGCSGRAVVEALMDTVEDRCMSYFT
ncbi:hypothetical protein OEZ85_012104 [Tetradesmus obliquus]|uniref:Uncharacterized protein n=1 Tax=Tetradesmus obliquus TaxID=3088 RepID=A0ABY8TSC6_TETOB|nr:hypothetical protein OEZ85_012104 [Tetradesmus obliquus]